MAKKREQGTTPPPQDAANPGKRGAVPKVATAAAPAAVEPTLKPTPKRAVTRTGAWQPVFLDLLARTGIVKLACDGAVVSRDTAYEHRRNDRKFGKAWQRSLSEAADLLEAEARRRAAVGVDEPVYQGGEKVGTIRRYSDTLLIFLLKGARPKKYRETYRHELAGVKGKPIETNATIDLSKLSLDELRDYRRIAARAGVEPGRN